MSGCSGQTKVFRPTHYLFDGTTWQFRVMCLGWVGNDAAYLADRIAAMTA